MTSADERGAKISVSIDSAYIRRMTRIGNRDFPDLIPLISASCRSERMRNRESTRDILARLATRGVLVESGVSHSLEAIHLDCVSLVVCILFNLWLLNM